MPKSYSDDLRERVIEAVEGGASRRETAERFEVSVSSAVKWLQRWHESKSAVPKPRGGSVSPLEEFAEQILDLIAQQPDLTLVKTVAELRKRRIRDPGSAPAEGLIAMTHPRAIRAGIWRCDMPKAPRQLPTLPPPNRANPTARANSGLDKTWEQGRRIPAG